jgi:hypothetical protein
MKSQLLTILLLFISTFTFAQFRNTTWGMSKEQVRKIEETKLESDYGSNLIYSFDIEDMKCRLFYTFNDKNKLISILYKFSSPEWNMLGNNTKIALEKMVANIVSKYGPSTYYNDKSFFSWNLKDFSIKATSVKNSEIEVLYTPPAPSLKDIL